MALVLSLKKGQDFYVGEEQFVLEKIHSDTRFRIRHAATRKHFEISDEDAAEILSDVYVSAGDRPASNMARIAIAAPDDVLILRGEKKRHNASS
jgi:hypothetical protein